MSNLVNYVTKSSAQTSNIPNGIRFTYTEIKDTYCAIVLNLSLDSTQTYVISFDVLNLPANANVSFGIYQSGMKCTTRIYNGHNQYTITGVTGSSLTFDDSVSSLATGSVFDIINFYLMPLDAQSKVNLTNNGIINCNQITDVSLLKNILIHPYGDLATSGYIEY